MGAADYVILALVAAAIVFAALYIAKCHKKGKCVGCGGDCRHCACKKKDK